ncbi:MAG: SUMF1/EgtB/PvdO family nonheme iron enzyme [Chitinophagales bacterium]
MRYIIIILLFSFSQLLANNVHIAELSTPDATHFQLELSWENSWKLDSNAPYNHDAVWLFAKYQEEGGKWQHLKLSPDSAAHDLQNSDLALRAEADSVGVFIYSNSNGAFPYQSTSLKIQQVSGIDLQNVNLKVFAIEMAYIPAGGYFLGDSLSNFTFRNGSDYAPLWVDSENAISVGTGLSELCDTCSYTENIPADYPKGTEGFYCMKYEISQEQFAAFLNTLDFNQQNNRIGIDLSGANIGSSIVPIFKKYRNGIVVENQGDAISNSPAKFAYDLNTNNAFNSADDGQNIPCNFLNEEDLKAYLDWSGLRPMTELEFEKICRGNENFDYKEYAWGNALVSNANNLSQSRTAAEYCTDSISPGHGFANHLYPITSGEYYIEGPIRCGFAANAQSDRLTSGAAYYGVMEMSGNLWEQCVRAYGAGVSFDGKCGDGQLDADGNSNETAWSNGNADLFIFSGGSWFSLVFNNLNYEFRDLAVSDRFYGNLNASNRRNSAGGRGVR